MSLYTVYPPQKHALAPVHVRLCNRAETSLPWKLLRTYLESCASIVQAAVCRPPRYWPDELRRPPKRPRRSSAAAERCPLKKSPQIHASS